MVGRLLCKRQRNIVVVQGKRRARGRCLTLVIGIWVDRLCIGKGLLKVLRRCLVEMGRVKRVRRKRRMLKILRMRRMRRRRGRGVGG